MIIDRIEAIPYSIPMAKPLHFASGSVTKIDHVLLRMTTDTGIVGVADVPPRPYTYGETQASVIGLLTTLFADALIGTDPLDRGVIHSRLNRTIGNHATKGAVDIAVWDIIGKSLGQPVHRLLGGYTNTVRAAHMIGFADGPEMVEEALRYREQYGISVFKVKVGRRPLSLDIDLCFALRAGLGSDVELYLDANRGWTASEAIEVLEATSGLGLTFFEEPDDAQEILGRRRLVGLSRIPIVADESAPTLGDAAREIQTGGATALSIKTARSGFSESQKILAYAEALGIDVIMGNQIDTQIGSTATVVFGAAFEYSSRRAAELSNFLDMSDDLVAEPLVISGGSVSVPTAPGVGVEIDPEKLAHYRLDERN
ncbi:mandelate racemase/muconate lactonizing enzyme family protein [Subtercola frigoramans]|uniref:L-alanine-DL-glutamate epimerase-like enolase superfamily enzyme n=1 Tax=Subtercola frigoramans TaxID=120298 RepID=A0ABS2LB26_9MICO|nr:enolase C-terminal domain-like protein [Subtercola frigoramans]MBM7473686.1 L-alanine-DL-glutamate epimerase-like enolase superfamily enzyme [Subtercola frigoramans]